MDVFYLHNPETQLAHVSREEFKSRLADAFAFLERACREEKIRSYGLATWNAFRVPAGEREGIALAEVVRLARDVGGSGHHLRWLQLPFNLGMTEGWGLKNQSWDSTQVSTFECAQRAGMLVVGSATLFQARLLGNLPAFIGEMLSTQDDAASAIQFSRSAPGLTTALVGMGRRQHVEANLSVLRHPPAEPERWMRLFQS